MGKKTRETGSEGATGDPEREATFILDAVDSAVVTMPWQAWAKLPNHPRQRDVEQHAKASHWDKLKSPPPVLAGVLRRVTAAEFEGRWYKVDGHTRTYLWERGDLEPPETVEIVLYRPTTRQELNDLYAAFDAASAAQSQHDKVWGAIQEAGLELQSARLKRGFLTTALQVALHGFDLGKGLPTKRGFDEYEAISLFARELKALDGVDPKWEAFTSGVIAAGLIGLTIDPAQTDFWSLLARQQGSMQLGKRDPIEGVLELIRETRQRKEFSYDDHAQLCARVLNGWSSFRNFSPDHERYWFKRRVRMIELAPLVAETREIKGMPPIPLSPNPVARSRAEGKGGDE